MKLLIVIIPTKQPLGGISSMSMLSYLQLGNNDTCIQPTVWKIIIFKLIISFVYTTVYQRLR